MKGIIFILIFASIFVPDAFAEGLIMQEDPPVIFDGTDQWENTGVPEEEPTIVEEKSKVSFSTVVVSVVILIGMGYGLYRAKRKYLKIT